MSEENLDQSLGAAREALGYLVASLERAGFGDNSPAYEKMAEVLVGQRLWAEENDVDRFDADFRAVGELSLRLDRLIAPYARMARTLSALEQMAAQPPRVASNTPEGEVVQAIGDRPASLTAISAKCALSTREVRRVLRELVATGAVVEARSGSRTRYAVAEIS